MIIKGFAFGIKKEREDISSYFHKILDSNPSFLLAGSYSYRLPLDLWNKLKSLKCPKYIVLPLINYNRNNTDLSNKLNIIKSLIRHDVVVLINSLNHSKFMLTDKHCFIGSNNLTRGGIFSNIENFTYMTDKYIDYIDWKNEIFNLFKGEIEKYGNVDNIKNKEDEIATLQLKYPIIELEMKREDLIKEIYKLEGINNALISVTESYQHLGKKFEVLAEETKNTITLIDESLISLTSCIYSNLEQQYKEKKRYDNIYIKDVNIIKDKIETLDDGLRNLSSYRKELFQHENMEVNTTQDMYEKIEERYTFKNKNNLEKDKELFYT